MVIKRSITGYPILVSKGELLYLATVPSLPGCFSQGKTPVAARENAEQAIAVYLDRVLPCDGIGYDQDNSCSRHVKLMKKGLPYPLVFPMDDEIDPGLLTLIAEFTGVSPEEFCNLDEEDLR